MVVILQSMSDHIYWQQLISKDITTTNDIPYVFRYILLFSMFFHCAPQQVYVVGQL